MDSLPETVRGDKGFGSTGIAETPILDRKVMAVQTRNTTNSEWTNLILEAGKKDGQWSAVKSTLMTGKLIDNLSLQDDLMLFKNRIYLPDCNDLKLTVTRRADDAKVVSHFGRDKTMELLTRNYYWPTLEDLVSTYVKTCDACQRNKTARHKKYSRLQPQEVTYHPWEHISMDFITDLPRVNGHDKIWVIVDRFT